MYIDIHRHSSDRGEADLILRNVFHNENMEDISHSYLSVGLHPWHVSADSLDTDIDKVRQMARSKRVIAIGEAGLDKHVEVDFAVQEEAFDRQMKIAEALNKPMIIHCVHAYNEVLHRKKVLKNSNPWMIHWFNASYEMGMELARNGFYLSFGKSLFNQSCKAFKAFERLPLDRLFFETDDANISIRDVYKRASELRGIPVRKLQEQIIINFQNCFEVEV